MPEVVNNFAKQVAIKETKESRRYKQKEIADGIGVSEAAVSRWMRGDDLSNASLSTIAKICQWLKIPIQDLIEIKLDEEPA